jgi:hypothetical protein
MVPPYYMQGIKPCLCQSREGFLQDGAQLAMQECLFKEMNDNMIPLQMIKKIGYT